MMQFDLDDENRPVTQTKNISADLLIRRHYETEEESNGA
jgi:hypothetical protein